MNPVLNGIEIFTHQAQTVAWGLIGFRFQQRREPDLRIPFTPARALSSRYKLGLSGPVIPKRAYFLLYFSTSSAHSTQS